ncbi:uncharacterized protein BROUX77_007898 [Berkeleyomyces rouxiae]|uniref:uncharacterized protein n=1 Tax=Berkeleyomyces rouxiae TaxID=2035830 RepID=UPI003B79C32D
MPRAVSFSMDIGLLKFSTVPAGSSLTVQQFERLLETRGSRLKPSLDTRLGPALYHDKLLQVVDDFYQATTRRLFHGGLPPKTYDEEISMQTKDGKRIIIGIMSTRESGVILPSRIWKTDAPRKLESIRVACPDQRLDYEFVLETNDSGKADAQYSKLLKEIQVTGVPTHAETPYLIRFPKPNSCPDEITGTEIRTTNRFPFRDTYYQIEVSVVRRWSGMGTEGSFNESTEVSFTCMDWYTKLGNWSDSDVQDPRKADMCELFLHKPTYEESLSQYLDYATEVQRLLEKAKDMGS